jgi:hypothetical protein
MTDSVEPAAMYRSEEASSAAHTGSLTSKAALISESLIFKSTGSLHTLKTMTGLSDAQNTWLSPFTPSATTVASVPSK